MIKQFVQYLSKVRETEPDDSGHWIGLGIRGHPLKTKRATIITWIVSQ